VVPFSLGGLVSFQRFHRSRNRSRSWSRSPFEVCQLSALLSGREHSSNGSP